jgi:AraC-like DNA-binding protein
MRWGSLAEFLDAPVGRAVRGRGWAVWCAAPDLCGAVLWGAPDETVAREYTTAFGFACDDRIARYQAVLDARSIDRIDERALSLVMRFFDGRRAGLAAKMGRVVVVRPARDLPSTVVAGVLPLSAAISRMQIVEDLAQAESAIEARVSAGELARLAEEAQAADGFLGRLQAVVERGLPRPELAAVGAAVGLSVRSLQRRLREEGSSFRQEVLAARLRVAARLLVGGDEKITAIALECGFPSSQHFANQFRRARGLAPSEYRARASESPGGRDRQKK